jgi:AcrR family transcriptional regulator
VDAILDATERLLDDEPLDGLTTNRVAERAGVSVGSLYQYFPNKEAIVSELALRLERRTVEAVRTAMVQTRDLSTEETCRAAARVLLGRQLGSPRLRRVLQLDLPRRWRDAADAATTTAVTEIVMGALAERAPDLREGDREIMGFMIQHALEGIAEAAVRVRPEYLDDAAFAEELAQLLFRYVRR